MSITAITFDEFLAELATEELPLQNFESENPAKIYPELFRTGSTLESIDNFIRFDRVRQDLIREVRGGLCTLEQAVAYLENFELYLHEELKKSASR